MKTKILFISFLFITLFSCNQKRPEPNFYKNLYTGEILDKSEYDKFLKKLIFNYIDTTKGKEYVDSIAKTGNIEIAMHFDINSMIFANDSIIQPFNYDVRIGNEYIVRANSYEKISMKVPLHKFRTVNGDSIQIGGERDKPVLLNLWFAEC